MAEILFDCKDKLEADGLVTQFLGDLTVDEQKEFLAFMQGFRFAKGLQEGKTATVIHRVIEGKLIGST